MIKPVFQTTLQKAASFLAFTAFIFATPIVSAQQLENSLLWKIEGNGIEESYLFGTIHVLPQSEFNLQPKVTKAFEACKSLVMELDMSNPNMQTEMMKYATMNDDTTLDQLLSKGDYEKLSGMLKESTGMSIEMVNTLKPFIVSTLLLGRYVEGQPASFELTLTQMATQSERRIVGLETIESQMKIFDETPYISQAKDLSEMINDEEKMRRMYADMIRMYQKESPSALFDFTAAYLDDPKELNVMLTQRNMSWIPLISELAKEEPRFFAVGAAHLGGEMGVINLLRREGFTVTPVM